MLRPLLVHHVLSQQMMSHYIIFIRTDYNCSWKWLSPCKISGFQLDIFFLPNCLLLINRSMQTRWSSAFFLMYLCLLPMYSSIFYELRSCPSDKFGKKNSFAILCNSFKRKKIFHKKIAVSFEPYLAKPFQAEIYFFFFFVKCSLLM